MDHLLNKLVGRYFVRSRYKKYGHTIESTSYVAEIVNMAELIDQCISNALSYILCYDIYMISPLNSSVLNVFPKFMIVLLLFYFQYIFHE
jgi:hypothetical protein